MIDGKAILERLIDQIIGLGIKICIAVPEDEFELYSNFISQHYMGVRNYLNVYPGQVSSPLHRMNSFVEQSRQFLKRDYTHVIRITHDKIFIDTECLRDLINKRELYEDIDYLYPANLPDGCGFEIISAPILKKAAEKFREPIEHISYAIKDVCPKDRISSFTSDYDSVLKNSRLLIDFPEDLEFMKAVHQKKPKNLDSVHSILFNNPFLNLINKQPLVTVYTCAYNEQSYIEHCIDSVFAQTINNDIEYIIVDDCSTDRTYEKLITSPYYKRKQIKVYRNEKNLGLSSSSNVALNMARGKFILRLDADDALLFPFSLEKLCAHMLVEKCDALYPSFLDQHTEKIHHGKETHHVGGCLFLTKAIRNIQFTERLRGFEGRDLFERAKNHLNISYYDELPTFFYRNKPKSMSKTNKKYRDDLEDRLRRGIMGTALVGGNYER